MSCWCEPSLYSHTLAHTPFNSLSSSWTPVRNIFSAFIVTCRTTAEQKRKKIYEWQWVLFKLALVITSATALVLYHLQMWRDVSVDDYFRVVLSFCWWITWRLGWYFPSSLNHSGSPASSVAAYYQACYGAPDTNASETPSLLYWSALLSAANVCASGSRILWIKQKWKLQTAAINTGLTASSISFDCICAPSLLAILRCS